MACLGMWERRCRRRRKRNENPGELSKPKVLNLEPVERESQNEGEFIELARTGDAEAYGAICVRYETRLLRQAMRLCRNERLAEDLAQETLVEGWKCLHRYDGSCQLFTWLCAILLNRYRKTLRKNRLWLFRTVV